MKISKSDQEKAIARLQKYLKPGDTVHTVLRHVSRSGMSRRIDIYKIEDGEPIYLTASVADLLGLRCKTHDNGLTVGGCGMDMGFHVVYELSFALYHKNFWCTGENCPSNDHSNGDRNHNSHLHNDGGYALRQRWI